MANSRKMLMIVNCEDQSARADRKLGAMLEPTRVPHSTKRWPATTHVQVELCDGA